MIGTSANTSLGVPMHPSAPTPSLLASPPPSSRSTPNNMLYLVNALSQGFVAAPAVGKSVVARSTSANMLYGEPRPVQIIPSVPPLYQKTKWHILSQIALLPATEHASGRPIRPASA